MWTSHPRVHLTRYLLWGILHDSSETLELDCMNYLYTGCSHIYSYTCLDLVK